MNYIIIFLISAVIGFLLGCLTARLIQIKNQKSVVKKPCEYSHKDREQLVANNELLLSQREEHAAEEYK